jgi:hypothetical protein
MNFLYLISIFGSDAMSGANKFLKFHKLIKLIRKGGREKSMSVHTLQFNTHVYYSLPSSPVLLSYIYYYGVIN